MAKTSIRYLLDDKHDARCIRVVSGAITLAEGAVRSWVTLTRTGSFTDPRYGRFEITAKMLSDMVRNFELVKLEVAGEWIAGEKKIVAADPPVHHN